MLLTEDYWNAKKPGRTDSEKKNKNTGYFF